MPTKCRHPISRRRVDFVNSPVAGDLGSVPGLPLREKRKGSRSLRISAVDRQNHPEAVHLRPRPADRRFHEVAAAHTG